MAGGTIDDNGHGTVNAGAAAASTNNARGIAGLAHGAQVLPVKVLNTGGTGTYAAISAGIIWAADHGAKVVNLSLGGLAPSQTLCDAVKYALDKGAFVDAASGNLGVSDPVYPASCPGVVGVGATDPSDAVPAWSDTGKGNVFVAAPGTLVHGTYPGDRYALATGTSVSTALVSGLASLLLAQDPTRTPAEIRRILAVSSDKAAARNLRRRPAPHVRRLHLERDDRLRADQRVPRADDAVVAAGRRRRLGLGSGSTSDRPAGHAAAAPAPDFALTVPPSAVSAKQATEAKWTISTAAQNGFTARRTLSVSGLPAGATASFAPPSVPASGSSDAHRERRDTSIAELHAHRRGQLRANRPHRVGRPGGDRRAAAAPARSRVRPSATPRLGNRPAGSIPTFRSRRRPGHSTPVRRPALAAGMPAAVTAACHRSRGRLDAPARRGADGAEVPGGDGHGHGQARHADQDHARRHHPDVVPTLRPWPGTS